VERKGNAAYSFSTREFMRTVSPRDLLTSFSLALLLMACFDITDYYLFDDWVDDNESVIKWTSLLFIMPMNHVFYRAEHKRPNNFIGRNIHDHIFLLLFAMLTTMKLFLYGTSFEYSASELSNILPAVIVVIIWVILFELLIAIIKRILKLVRWQIL
jgi:hypothetical protein